MRDYKYGILKNDWEVEQSNPIYLSNYYLEKDEATKIKLVGKGRITQIVFISDKLRPLLSVKIDGNEEQKINNGYCMKEITNEFGRGNVILEQFYDEKEGNLFRYTFFIPFVFEKDIEIKITAEEEKCKINWLHVYYEVLYYLKN